MDGAPGSPSFRFVDAPTAEWAGAELPPSLRDAVHHALRAAGISLETAASPA